MSGIFPYIFWPTAYIYNDLSNLLADQFLSTAMLTPHLPLHKLYISITIFNLVSEIITVHDYFFTIAKHVKICSLIRHPSMPSHLSALVARINLQLLNRLPNNTLTHWGRVTHICVGNLTIFVSDNGLWPDQRQAIIWTNAGILIIGPLWTNISEILIEIPMFSFKKMRLKVSSAKWRPCCLGLNVLIDTYSTIQIRRICTDNTHL